MCSEAEHRLTQSRVPGRPDLRGWGLVPHPFKDGESAESRHRFSFNRAKRVIDGRMFGVPLEPAEAE